MISTDIRLNNHNSYKIESVLFSYPFGVAGYEYITHSFQTFALSPLTSEIRAKTKFFNNSGVLISEINHTFPVNGIFDKVELPVEVPIGAFQAQLVFLKGTTSWWVVEPKSEDGQIATPFNANIQSQLTFITQAGIYTGMVNAQQIVVSGTIENPDETLETRLVTINQNAINVSATVSGHGSRLTTIEAGQITLTNTVSGHGSRLTTIEAGQITLSDTLTQKTTKITSSGIYTGNVTATQVKTGKMSSTSGATYFNLDTNEIYMNGGANGRIQISPSVGFKMMDSSGVQIGGITTVGGQLTSISQSLTNKINPNFWASVGTVNVLGKTWDGIFGYMKSDTQNPTFRILAGVGDSGWAAGNYGIFVSKNEKSMVSVYENQNVGHVELIAIGTSGQLGEMVVGPQTLTYSTDNYWFEIGANGIYQGKDWTYTCKIPLQKVGTVHNVSSAVSTVVTFPMAFPAGSAVKVFATPTTTATGVIVPKVFNESPTGFSIVIGGSGFSNISVNWTAIAE